MAIYPSNTDYHFLSLHQTAEATGRPQNLRAAWQTRTQRQVEDAATLEREQIKLFGGLPGDDVGLCFRMLEYFGGLDFIDT